MKSNFFGGADGALAVIKRLMHEQALAYWKRYATAFALMAVVAGTTAVSAYLIGTIVNQAYVARDFPSIGMLAIATVVLFAAKGAANYGQAVILSQITNEIISTNQTRLFSKLLSENLAYLTGRHSAEFMARLVTGATSVAQILNLVITSVGRDLLSLIGLACVMVYQDPWMSLFGFLIGPPALFGLRKLIGRVRRLAETQFSTNVTILETMQETLQGIRTVKAFTLEPAMRARIETSAADLRRYANKVARVSSRSSPLMETLGGFAIAAALTYGGYGVIIRNSPPGEFFSFLTAFLLAYEPAKRLARLGIDLNANLIGAKMLLEIIDSEPSEPDDSAKPELAPHDMRVEFRDVQFSYRPGEVVLRQLSFAGEPGKVTALVGPSGGGKSTVMSLLLRFYEPDGGAVLVGGQPIADYTRQSLRKQTAYVGQDVFLFKGTVRENIVFGKPDATEEEIINAAKAAYAHDFIMSFPLQYATPVGEHGTQLSGGQRQRIAIARALIRGAPLILLDEATASLDSESEKQVQMALERLCEGKTVIVVAHRLHTITHADRIFVLEDGAIVESGRHDDLLRRNGRYASLFRLQQRDEKVIALAASG